MVFRSIWIECAVLNEPPNRGLLWLVYLWLWNTSCMMMVEYCNRRFQRSSGAWYWYIYAHASNKTSLSSPGLTLIEMQRDTDIQPKFFVYLIISSVVYVRRRVKDRSVYMHYALAWIHCHVGNTFVSRRRLRCSRKEVRTIHAMRSSWSHQ